MFAAESDAKVGIAVADAFIGCWNAKHKFDQLRPVTYIVELIAPSWEPLLNTPAFPKYPSGHSVQVGAVATVLADLFGDNTTLVDHTHDERGLAPRTFTSFTAMAAEATMSRVYGGIHYQQAVQEGLTQGHCIGEAVNRLETRRYQSVPDLGGFQLCCQRTRQRTVAPTLRQQPFFIVRPGTSTTVS